VLVKSSAVRRYFEDLLQELHKAETSFNIVVVLRSTLTFW